MVMIPPWLHILLDLREKVALEVQQSKAEAARTGAHGIAAKERDSKAELASEAG